MNITGALDAAIAAVAPEWATRRALADLAAAGWVELTVPAKPNSRLQKYRATGKGRS